MAESSYKNKPRWPTERETQRTTSSTGSLNPWPTAELLGILIGKGTRKEDSHWFGKGTLGSIRISSETLLLALHRNWWRSRALDSAKAAYTLRGFWVGEEDFNPRRNIATASFRRSSDVANHYLSFDERFKERGLQVLLLNRANRLIKEVTISEGTLEASLVHPRDVFSRKPS